MGSVVEVQTLFLSIFSFKQLFMSKIVLLQFGKEIPFSRELVEAIERRFDSRVEVKQAGFKTKSFDAERKQYDADVLLGEIRAQEVGSLRGARVVLGVFPGDLFIAEKNFVFGLDEQSCCVVSTARLDPRFYGEKEDGALFKERLVKEVLHELGHAFGLEHCPDKKCVMVFSESIEGVDFKGKEFCGKCRERLECVLK